MILPAWFTREAMRRWSVSLLISATLALAAYPIVKHHVGVSPHGVTTVSSDVLVYVDAARDLLAGRDMYKLTHEGQFPYVYPPFYALLNIPLVPVDPLVLDIAWYLLNVGLLCAIIHMAFFLFTGTAFTSVAPKDQWLYAGLSIVFAARYLLRNAQQANVNVLILFLVILGLFLIRRTGKARWASLIGVAAAIKIFPVILLVYFSGRRQWRAFGFAVFACLAATLLPSVAVGLDRNWKYLQSFLSYVQRRLGPEGVAVENFSLWGTCGRILSKQIAFTLPREGASYVNIASLDLRHITYMIYGIDVLLIALVYYVARGANNSDNEGKSWSSGGAIVIALLAMNLVAVLVEEHHTVTYVVAFLYVVIAWRAAILRPRPLVAVMFGAGIMSNLISYDAIVPVFGKRAYMTCLAWSLPVLPVAIILLSLTLYCMSVQQRMEGREGSVMRE